jgi:hypothetical protein
MQIVQAVALPEVQSVGEYEARYGAYNTQRYQQRPPEQGEEEASRDSPIIFRHLHKKKSESKLPESAVQVRVSHGKEFMPFRRKRLFLKFFISFFQSRL